MPSRRDQIVMSEDEIKSFLTHQRILNVATNGPTGHPHVVAMWFTVLDGNPAFWTFARSQKIVNIRRDDRISALVESGDSYSELKGLEMTGTARLIEDRDQIFEIGKAIAVKYTGPAALNTDSLPFIEAQVSKRIGVLIDVERWVSWDHTKLGGVY
ncbi:MAG TPA: pyridoxamine 5'-phosphate oxidase family protein [Ilumatobacteraceae bacterium]|nr:pyridoxamine 5'-phosphate oxidase family protein [Ilumatobacteraceae bacterium]